MDRSISPDCNRKRSLDKRRETSKVAARDRRGKEADIFEDLKDEVPIVDEPTVTHVDRIALLRVASTLCRLRKKSAGFFKNDLIIEDEKNSHCSENGLSECLDGFVLIADADGTILYVTESVSIFVGLTQTDLVGRYLSDFVHPNDYDELTRATAADGSDEEAATGLLGQGMVVRMKTVISPRGRSLNLKSALYKATMCRFRVIAGDCGRLWLLHAASSPAGQSTTTMSNSVVKGSETTNRVFMTRHTAEMRFTYVSDSLNAFLRNPSRSLTGTSFFDLIFPPDLPQVVTAMKELNQKGHCRTTFYRLLGPNASVTWVQTEAMTVNHTTKGTKGHYVLCSHSILGTQCEIDSWTTSSATLERAARPAKTNIKSEIIDAADYYGLQPTFIECVDFEPLIEPIPQFTSTDIYRTVMNDRRQPENLHQPQQPVGTSEQRNDVEYEEVLQWLFRDESSSPPPYAANICGPSNLNQSTQSGRNEPLVHVGCPTGYGTNSTATNRQPQQRSTFLSGARVQSRESTRDTFNYAPSGRTVEAQQQQPIGNYGMRPAGAASLGRDIRF
jgi:PAS domain-containing protein